MRITNEDLRLNFSRCTMLLLRSVRPVFKIRLKSVCIWLNQSKNVFHFPPIRCRKSKANRRYHVCHQLHAYQWFAVWLVKQHIFCQCITWLTVFFLDYFMAVLVLQPALDNSSIQLKNIMHVFEPHFWLVSVNEKLNLLDFLNGQGIWLIIIFQLRTVHSFMWIMSLWSLCAIIYWERQKKKKKIDEKRQWKMFFFILNFIFECLRAKYSRKPR